MGGKIIWTAVLVLFWSAPMLHCARCVGPGVQWFDAVISGACLGAALLLTKAWIKA